MKKFSAFKTTNSNKDGIQEFEEQGLAVWVTQFERLAKGIMWLGIGYLAVYAAHWFRG